MPLSGEAAIAGNVARGIDAYFKYVNDKGGVFGRKIKYTYLDDGYDPGRAVNNTIRLVQQEQVFAVFSSLGTNNNLAVRKLLNDAKVPQLYVSSGATTFGRDYKKYPWTIGYIPPYSEEGEIYGRYVVKNLKKAKIAVLYQNDDYGRDLLGGLKKGLGAKAKSIVASVGYDPTSTDVQPQVTQLKASKANVFMVFAFGKFSLQAFNAVSRLGWKPQIFVNDVSSAVGADGDRPAERGERLDLDRLRQGSRLSSVGERQGHQALPVDPSEVRHRHQLSRSEGRLLHCGHGHCVHDGDDPQEGREEPDAGGPDQGGDPSDRARQSVRAQRHRRQDDSDRAASRSRRCDCSAGRTRPGARSASSSPPSLASRAFSDSPRRRPRSPRVRASPSRRSRA